MAVTKAKEYNLELAKSRAKVLSQGRDLTEVTHNSVIRNIQQFQRNPRNNTEERTLGAKQSIAQVRDQSRSVIMRAWVGSLTDTVRMDQGNYEAYSKIGQQTEFRAFFLKTPAGVHLLQVVDAGDGKMLGRMLMNIGSVAQQVNMNLGGKNIIADPIQVYMDLRKEMWERVVKTGDFTNLIQRQERLLQRVATTLAFTLSDRYVTLVSGADLKYLQMFRALFVAHLQQLPLGTVGDIQQVAFMFEAIFSRCDISMLTHKIARGVQVREMTDECNQFRPLAKALAIVKRTSSVIQPDT
jgi:hypothetical protein